MTCLFVIQFFNTAILILLVNAYFKEFNMPEFLKVALPEGIYPDLTFEWYSNLGKGFVFTMLINILQPVLAFLISYFIRLFFICRDRGCTKDRTKTKTKTV